MLVGHQSGFLERLIFRSLTLCLLLLLISVESIWAVDPNQPMSSYIRTRAADENGLPSIIDNIVQSQDGFLWLMGAAQLIRFDGRHFALFDRPLRVRAMTLGPDGDLWVGTGVDLERIPAAALNKLHTLPAVSYHPGPGESSYITSLHFTPNGVLWVGTHAGLYRFDHGAFSSTIPGTGIQRIEEASNGHLLVTTAQGFVELDGSRTVPHPDLETQLGVKATEIFHVFQDSHGVTWFCTANGVARQIGGSIKKLAPWGPRGHGTFRVYEDPQGSIWFSRAEGLFRATATGLELAVPHMQVRAMYGDRDGNLWVGTNGDGLYRFKDRAARTFTTADGLPGNVAMTVLVTNDGAVWSGFNCGGLARFDGKRFQIYNEKNGLLNSCVWSLAEDLNHDLWIGTYGGGAFHFHDGRFTQYSIAQGLASDIVSVVAATRDGSVWLCTAKGMSRIRNGQVRNYTQADGLSDVVPYLLYKDRTDGIWVQTRHGVERLAGDRFVDFSSLPKTRVAAIGEDRSGGLYFISYPDTDIYRLENNQVVQVAANFHGEKMVETENGDLWFTGSLILRVPPGGLDHPHQQDEPVDFAPFGLADGLASAQDSSGQPSTALTPDGKLWIATNQGLAVLDLPRLPRTDRKPTIYMQEVTVGRNQQPPDQELVLPAGTHHLELYFDAIELSSPEKIRLQYRLDSVDSEWLDAPFPPHAMYTNMPPGKHAFHVRACNRDGIWDRLGTIFYITQRPYFYQTRWFVAATIAFGLLVLAGAYQLRLRQVASTLSARFEGQLAERSRIARDLHDTLLQSFSALLLRLQSVSKILPTRPEDAKQRVDGAIEQVSNAIAEGRDAVHELRAGGANTVDLQQSISNFVSELAASSAGESRPRFHVLVEGTPHNLNPMVRDEAYRIAVEALRNAVRYAAAKQIEVEVGYHEQLLRLRIRDDGRGIDPDVLDQGHAPGHWGLRGMRERAKLLGGNFEVWSQVGSGSEVELTIPAGNAYAKPASRWTIFLRSWRK